MKKCVRLQAALAAALVALPLGGCAPRQETGELRTIDVCEVTHSVFYAPQYVAMSQGFFAEEGLSVELTVGQGADKVMAAVLSGSVNIGLAGPEASIYVMEEGRQDYPQVFAQLTQRDGSFLVGPGAEGGLSVGGSPGKPSAAGPEGRCALHDPGVCAAGAWPGSRRGSAV